MSDAHSGRTKKAEDTQWSIETMLVHGGLMTNTVASGKATVPPIHATTTYIYEQIEDLDKAFEGTNAEGQPAFVYARHGNPNTHALEEAVSKVEGGIGAVACGSGMAAIHIALLAAGLTSGAKIISSRDLYGPTISMLRKLFTTVGATLILTDFCEPEAIELIKEEEPDIIYLETISNPLVKVVDLDAISAAARAVGAVTVVDSTFSPPTLLRPIEHGFDLVLHSATKYISGHGDSTGGIVVSAKNALLDQLKSYSILVGAVLSPFEAHLMLRGLRTLSLRVEKQCANALQIAHFLQNHPGISHVYYPGLAEHPQHKLASHLMNDGQFGGLLAFDLKEPSRTAALRFMNRLKLCVPATTLGDVFTLVSYPPMSSHRTMNATELKNMGITESCIRMSAGIENANDIINDLDQALS